MKLNHVEIPAGTPYGWMHWCPGCDKVHRIPTTTGGPLWSFNGDLERPTFAPSVKHEWTHGEQSEHRCCHYFIVDGAIQFCGDCTHALAGKTVPLPELPKAIGKTMTTKWLIERTGSVVPLYLANFYGREQWTEYANSAVMFETKEAAEDGWKAAQAVRPEIADGVGNVEAREHGFG